MKIQGFFTGLIIHHELEKFAIMILRILIFIIFIILYLIILLIMKNKDIKQK